MNRAAAVLAVLAVLAAAPLAATTFVMMSDPDLVDRTPLVVEARVLSSDEAPAGGTPSTDYLIEVERVLKGDLPGSNLVVRVPGGIGPDGIGLKIWGAPSFRAGERAVLFLRPTADGTFRVAQLMLGAFHEVRAGGETLLVRSLDEAHEVAAPGEPEEARARYRQPRRRAAFLDWIAARADGAAAAAEDYFYQPQPGAPGVIVDGFTLFESSGLNLRWFAFDTGQVARWRVHEDGQPGLTLAQAIDAFGQGMATWNNDAGSDVAYGFLSPNTTSAIGGLTTFDSQNVLLFEDPTNNPDFEGDFSCSSGGVLAIGGPWFENQPRTYNGQQYRRIVGGDIITNKGLQCFFLNAGNNRVRVAAELFGHELGHTLGFGHSCGDDNSPACSSPALNDALMRAFIHGGSRGPRLGSDDIAAVRTLYGNGTNPGPGPGTAPAAPTGLAAQLQGASQALLTWNDNSNNETAFRIQQKVGNGAFANLPDRPANTETLTVGGLAAATTYTWQVRAVGSSANSGFSNQVSLTTPAALPAAPSGLEATPIAPTVILLDWEDESVNETGFVIEAASPVELFHEVGTAPANATSFALGGRVAGRPYTFRVRAANGALLSAPSNEASATTQNDATAACAADADTLCLLAERFRVEVQWRDQINGGNGIGLVQASPVGGSKTGVFSFFNPNNIELIVKALDGNPVNSHYWIFYGALSTVEYWVTVTDTATGDSNTYHNPPGELCGVPDTEAFPALPAPAVTPASAPRAAGAPLKVRPAAGASIPCVPGAETLCLADGRFEVTVDWTDQRTLDSGPGVAVPGTERTGYFWFFNAENIELVVKILDATAISDNWWVFYGSLSDVQYTITVRDTVTGLEGSYVNDPGNFCGDADTDSFPDTNLP